MKILHFSDPHAGGGAEDWLAYLDKRWVGVFNYKYRRCYRFDLKYLRRVVEYAIASKVDVAVCTGDLTSTGQPGEFEIVREILQPLRDSGIPILYTPGNHDCYVKRQKCVDAVNEMVEYLSCDDYKFSDFPLVRTIGSCDFILLNSSYPSNLLCSWGFIRKRDSKQVEAMCEEQKNRPRILVGHYPLLEENSFLRTRHRLFGQGKIIELLKSGKIDISLCGHVHRPENRIDERGRGESISGSVSSNARCSLITYDESSDIFNFETVDLKDSERVAE